MLKHISISLLISYSIFLLFYFKANINGKTKLLLKIPYILSFSCIWSIIPNIIDKLEIQLLSKYIHSTFISNIFFFHGILFKMNTTGGTWGLGIIFIVLFSLLILYFQLLSSQEKILNLQIN